MGTTYDLQDKVVLITGAAGGIGAATARALYTRGATLVLTDVTQQAVDELASQFDAERALPLALDVTDSEATQRVVAQAVARFGRLDIAFANAGVVWRDEPATLRSCTESEFERIVGVDLMGVWKTTKAALPQIVRARGQVVVTSSIYSFLNGMVNAPYAASKAAVEMLGRSLRAELAGTGASASVLYPGWIATPMAQVAFGGHPLITELVHAAYPAFLRDPIAPDVVAQALADGLEKRKPRIVAPRRWVPISLMRGIVNVATDAYLERHSALHALVRKVERATPAEPSTKSEHRSTAL